MPALVSRHAIEHRLLSGILQVGIERGVNPQAALVHLVAAITLLQIAADLLEKPRRQVVVGQRETQLHRQRLQPRGFGGGDLAIFQHGVDHQIAARQCPLGMQHRRIFGRAFGQAGQQRRFVEREVAGVLVEIVLRARLESVHAMPQIDLVAIHGEDLLLGEPALDLDSQHGLLQLAA